MTSLDFLEASAMFSIFAMLAACLVAFFMPPPVGGIAVLLACIPGALTAIALHFHKWTGETL